MVSVAQRVLVLDQIQFQGNPMTLSDEHLAELSEAKRLLENPGLAVKITNLITDGGSQIKLRAAVSERVKKEGSKII